MKKYRCKVNCCKKILYAEKTSNEIIHNEKNLNNDVDIRQKRIDILFKVIYVVAIMFGALFVDLAKGFGKGLNSAYMIESFFVAFLFCLGTYMVLYVINELKCLRLYKNDCDQRQKELTEKSYNNIFFYLYSGFGIFLIFLIAVMFIPQSIVSLIDTQLLASTFVAALSLAGMTNLFFGIKIEQVQNGFKFVRCIFYTIALTSLFIAAGLNVG